MKKGILFVGYFLSEYGYGRCVCEDLSARFEEKGFNVVLTSSQTNRYRRLFDMLVTAFLRRADYQVAYVEVYNGLAFIWAELVCFLLSLLKKPYVVTLHGARMLQFSEKWPSRLQRLLQQASAVTTPSKIFQQEFSRFRADIQYIPNAVEISYYSYRQRKQPKARLGWLRKFEWNYNPLLAVKTLALLLPDFPETTLVMSGADFSDGSSEEVQEFVQEHHLLESLHLTGFIARPEIPVWFSQSDIYLNTTNVESFGIAVMEAAASGLCIVTTSVGELPYIWDDEKDALLVPADDVEAMVGAVRRLLTESGLAEKISVNARLKAEQYDWSAILPKWENLFASLMLNS